MRPAELQRRAKERLAQLHRRRADVRYRRVMGRLIGARLLTSNEALPSYGGPVSVRDALWAGEVEPRILELLPALLVKCPSMFTHGDALPEDLATAVGSLRQSREPQEFRGIPGRSLLQWLPRVGRRGKLPSRLKSFRLQAGDVELLDRLSAELRISQTAVLRRGLRAVASAQWLGPREASSK